MVVLGPPTRSSDMTPAATIETRNRTRLTNGTGTWGRCGGCRPTPGSLLHSFLNFFSNRDSFIWAQQFKKNLLKVGEPINGLVWRRIMVKRFARSWPFSLAASQSCFKAAHAAKASKKEGGRESSWRTCLRAESTDFSSFNSFKFLISAFKASS